MGHSDDPGDGQHARGTRGCGGNMLAAGAAAQKRGFLARNARSLMNLAASLRASRARAKQTA